jgi:hypothetical protein
VYKSDGAAQHGLDKVGVREEFAGRCRYIAVSRV